MTEILLEMVGRGPVDGVKGKANHYSFAMDRGAKCADIDVLVKNNQFAHHSSN